MSIRRDSSAFLSFSIEFHFLFHQARCDVLERRMQTSVMECRGSFPGGTRKKSSHAIESRPLPFVRVPIHAL